MRVNPTTGLGSFALTAGDKTHKKFRTGTVLLAKNPNAATTNQINIWEQPVYKSEQGYVRPGANDFLSVKSRGF
jgi:hypothetical protein